MSTYIAPLATVICAAIAAWASVFLANKKISHDAERLRQNSFADERSLFFQELQDLRAENKQLRNELADERAKVAKLEARLIVLESDFKLFEKKNGH